MAILTRISFAGPGPRALAQALVLVTLLASGSSLRAQGYAPEYQIKAVFLFNFAQFVEWPADAFASPAAPFVIGVLGEDPFGGFLNQVVHGEKVGTHPVLIERFRRVDEVGRCHILFISRSEAVRMRSIIERLHGRSMLTVSDAEDFARSGGVIRFVTERSKIRMRVNLDAAKAARLTISSKLLRSVEIVTRER